MKRGQLRLILLIICCCCFALGNKPGDPGAREEIVFGYSSSIFVGVDRQDVQAALDLWTAELAKTAGLREMIRATIFENLETLMEGIRQKTIDFVGMSFLEYLKIRNQVGIEPILIGTNGGSVGEEYTLIIHKGTPCTELKQLQGKNLLVEKSSGAYKIALLWLDTLLLRQHLSPSQSFFRSVKLVEKASQAVLPVFFRQVDACLLPRRSYDTMVELNPQIQEQTTIITISPLLAKGGLFVVKGTSQHKLEAILSTQKVWQTVRAKQLLTLWHTEGAAPFQPAYIQSIVNLYGEYKNLAKGR